MFIFKMNYVRVCLGLFLLQDGLCFGSDRLFQKSDSLRDRCVRKGFVIPKIGIIDESDAGESQNVEDSKYCPMKEWVSFPPVETPREDVDRVDCVSITVAIIFIASSLILHPVSRQIIGDQLSQYV